MDLEINSVGGGLTVWDHTECVELEEQSPKVKS